LREIKLSSGIESPASARPVLPRQWQERLEDVSSAISEELFDRQPVAHRNSVLPPEAFYDLMVVSTGTWRVWSVCGVGPLTDAFSLTSDWDNQWLNGRLEPEVIAEAHLDPASVFAGIRRFAEDRGERLARQREMLGALSTPEQGGSNVQ
jgi:transketolase